MDEEIRIMIAGGGTGGHLYPALAIGEEIMKRTNNVKVPVSYTHLTLPTILLV